MGRTVLGAFGALALIVSIAMLRTAFVAGDVMMMIVWVLLTCLNANNVWNNLIKR